MTHKEALELAISTNWKITTCLSGEKCWCRGVTTETMCNLLNEKLGISLQKQSFNNKLCRSNLNSTFFFQCMYALEVRNIHFEIDAIKAIKSKV